jgi:hypothetical protein
MVQDGVNLKFPRKEIYPPKLNIKSETMNDQKYSSFP